jgi:hypothetical protein
VTRTLQAALVPAAFLSKRIRVGGHVGGYQPEIQTNISKEAFEKREPG